MAFSPDGSTFVSGSSDGTLKLWDTASRRELQTLRHRGVTSVAFSPDGRIIVSGSRDNTLKVWATVSGRELRTLAGHRDWVKAVAFSPDGRTIVSASHDKTLKLWDAATGRELRSLAGHGGYVEAVAFSPDGRTIVSGSHDTTLRLWNSAGELLATTIATTDGEWLTITPEGFFDASERGADILSAVRGLEVFSIGQFFQSLYRPDLVREKLAGDPRGLVREAAARLDLSKAVASGNAPDVRLTLPARGLSRANSQIAVGAEISDRGGGIGRIEWRVNGITVGSIVRHRPPPASLAPDA